MARFGLENTDTAQAVVAPAAPVPPPEARAGGKQISLNFKTSPKVLRVIARGTLLPLIDEQEREAAALAARWANAEVGDVMPDASVRSATARCSPEFSALAWSMFIPQ